MIQRKMCNNATRKFPKNYDPMARQAQLQMDDVYQQSQEEIEANANTVEFADADVEIVEEPKMPDFMKAE